MVYNERKLYEEFRKIQKVYLDKARLAFESRSSKIISMKFTVVIKTHYSDWRQVNWMNIITITQFPHIQTIIAFFGIFFKPFAQEMDLANRPVYILMSSLKVVAIISDHTQFE